MKRIFSSLLAVVSSLVMLMVFTCPLEVSARGHGGDRGYVSGHRGGSGGYNRNVYSSGHSRHSRGYANRSVYGHSRRHARGNSYYRGSRYGRAGYGNYYRSRGYGRSGYGNYYGSYYGGYGGLGLGIGMFTGLALGSTIAAQPPAYTTVVVDDSPAYQYVSSTNYQPVASGYVAANSPVVVPVGTIVALIPPGAVQVVLGATTYYYLDGAYYLQQGTAFQVVPTPIGIVVPVLPVGALSTTINGQSYFQFKEGYYQSVISNGMMGFEAVSL